MTGATTFVTTLDDAAARALETKLQEVGYEFRDVANARFAARGENVNVVLYESGKLVVQGKGAQDFRDFRLQEIVGLPEPRLSERTIGADETGKGDYFGPLVVVACALSPEEERFLEAAHLVDSKTLADAQARNAARTLREVLPHEAIAIGPARYNELYESFRNLNTLLAWAHAKAISTLVERTGCRRVVLDRFCDEKVVRRALGDLASTLDLEVRPRAEDDPAVAAASVIARAVFLDRLDALSRRFDIKLPKGAGPPVLKAGRAFIRRHGKDALRHVAKLHFRTTDQIT